MLKRSQVKREQLELLLFFYLAVNVSCDLAVLSCGSSYTGFNLSTTKPHRECIEKNVDLKTIGVAVL